MLLTLLLLGLSGVLLAPAATIATGKPTASPQRKVTPAKRPAVAVKKPAPAATIAKAPVRRPAKAAWSPWKEPTYAPSTTGDEFEGEDPVVRQAAIDALGRFNGSVVVVDPNTGRILTIVNQKLAYKSGYQPCSTFKPLVGLAGLTEGIVERDTPLRVYGRTSFTLTQALAKSNNQYFASLGVKLGFDRVSYYARMFGLGERATLDVDAEQPGSLPEQPPKNGGVGMMCSFGEGIQLTPLQYAAAVSAIANGGTLYYLQHPKSQEEATNFVPKVKRHLDISTWIPDIRPGMMGAVEYGTARRAYAPEEPVLGKTGTCTDSLTPTHLGWFGSFNDFGKNRLVVVVLLTGGRPVNGPVASGVAGNFYKGLSEKQYFAREPQPTPVMVAASAAGQ